MSVGGTPMTEGMQELWALPVLSQEFRDGPIAKIERTVLRLRFDYETEVGDYAWQELTFNGVEAFVYTAHDSCTEDQVDAYDVLVEVVDSRWVAKLQAARRTRVPALRHLRIYFDEIGCYEVAAASFDPPPIRAG